MAKLSRGKDARKRQESEARRKAAQKAAHQAQLQHDAEKSERDAYVFEIQHMDHDNPWWRHTAVISVIILVAFAFELYAMNNDGGVMTWVFAAVLLAGLVVLWLVQRRYKAWELEHGKLDK